MAPTIEGLTEVVTNEAWWDRVGRHEVEVVGSNLFGHVVALGSIKWRDRRQFSAEELEELAANRAVVPGADGARLVAICPAGARTRTNPDFVFDADLLLSA